MSGDITISVGMDTKQVEAGQQRVGRSLEDIRSKSKTLEVQNKSTSASFDRLGGAMKAVAGAFVTTQLVQYVDTYRTLEGRLKTVTDSSFAFAQAQKSVLDIAVRTRAPLEAVTGLYQKSSMAAKELGASQGQVVKFTEAVSKALAVQGGSAATASGALLQLGQSLGSGIVRAEEFNSVLEGAYPIAQAAARGIAEAGGSVAKLRVLIADGQITSKEFFDGILSQSAALDKQFSGMGVTISSALTVMNTRMIDFIGNADKAFGISSALAQGILALGNNLDKVAGAIGIVASVLGARLGAGLIASAALWLANTQQVIAYQIALARMAGSAGIAAGAVGALNSALALIGGPIGAIIIGIGAAIYGLSQSSDAAEASQTRLNSSMQFFSDASSNIIGASKEQRKQIIADATAKISAHRAELQAVTALVQAYAVQLQGRGAIVAGAIEIKERIANVFRTEEKLTPLEAGKQFLQLNDALKEMDKGLATLKDIDKNGGKAAGAIGAVGAASKKTAGDVNALQSSLDDMQAKAVYDTITQGMDEQKKAILDVDIAVGRLTKQYGALSTAQVRQVQTIKEQTIEAARAAEATKAREKAAEEAVRTAEETRREFVRPFENAADDVQGLFKDTFKDIFKGGVNSFGDFAKKVRDIFIELAAQVAALMIFRPQMAGLGFGGAMAAIFGGGAATGGAASAAGSSGGIGSLFSGASSLNNVYSAISGGLNAPIFGPSSSIGNGINSFSQSIGLSSAPVYGPQLPGTTAAGSFTGGAALAGLAGNFGANALFGGNRGIGADIGGAAGGIGGTLATPAITAALAATPLAPLAPFLGPALGSFLGNAVGGLFGKKKSDKTALGSIDLGTGELSGIASLQGKKYSAENNAFRDFALTYAGSVADLVQEETGQRLKAQLSIQIGNRDGLRYAVNGTNYNTSDPSSFFRGITGALAGVAKDSGITSASLENMQTALKNIDFKDTQKALEDLSFAGTLNSLLDAPEKVTAAETALKSLKEQMDGLRETATRLGLSVEIIDKLEQKRIDTLKQNALNTAAADYIGTVSGTLGSIVAEIASYTENVKELNALNVSTQFLDLAHKNKLKALTDQLMQQDDERLSSLAEENGRAQDLIDSYKDLSESLRGSVKSMRLDGLSTLSGADKTLEARKQFTDLLTQALSGDIAAGGKLAGAGNTLRELSSKYYGGGAGFVADSSMVESGLLRVAAVADKQASAQEIMIEQNDRSIAAITSSKNSIVSMLAQLISVTGDKLPAALATLLQSTGGNVSGLASLYNFNDKAVALRGSLSGDQWAGVESLLSQYAPGVIAGEGRRTNYFGANSGANAAAIAAARLQGIPGFAAGGNPAMNQVSLVGEYGPELIKPMFPVRVQPLHTAGAANDNSGMVAQVSKMVEQVSDIADAVVSGNAINAKTTQELRQTLSRLGYQLDKMSAA